jgi:YesN/AraC family two-component response regulator
MGFKRKYLLTDMILYIQHMVCDRCIRWVDAELNRMNIPHGPVQIGWVEIYIELSPEQVKKLQENLEQCQLALINRKALIKVESIKHAIYDMINADEPSRLKTSAYISNRCKANYNYLSNLFMKETGCSIREFINKYRVERASQLIEQGLYKLTDIAYMLHYSSMSHFSNQFRKYAGIRPSAYRRKVHGKERPTKNL